MKNVKRILALTVSAALAVSCFAGCGNGAKKNSDTIVIGCSGPLTGDAAQYGVAVKNAHFCEYFLLFSPPPTVEDPAASSSTM